MGRTRPLMAIALSLVLVAGACTSASDELAATTTTTAEPPSTTTTVMLPPSTTTSQAPLAVVAITGDVDKGIASATSTFLSVIHDPRNDEGDIDGVLIDHHQPVSGQLEGEYAATATVQTLDTGGAVAVVTLETDDVVLAADEGDGWFVVGAHMQSLGAEPWFGDSPSRVLVLGSDARPGYTPGISRTDSIHIVTAVPAEGAGTVLGVPRDSWVSTDYGKMRINAITSSGRGPDAAFDFYVEDWDVPLDGYILTAFSGFEDLIGSAVGRLQIDLENSVPSLKYWPGFRSGEHTLTPTRTLDLARTRKGVPGGDFTRSYNHGLIMLAVLAMLQQGSIDDAPMLLGELVKHTETNLTPTQLIQLGATAFELDIGEIDNVVLPGHLGRATGGASVVFLEPEAEDIVADVVGDGLLTPPVG